MERQLRLLIVDDEAPDAELTARQVKLAGYDCVWKRVENEQGLRAGLREFQPNLIFSDFTMPGFDGLAALEISAAEAPDTPFIFVSGTLGEHRAIQALKLGATDWVPKDDLTRLAPAVARALADSTMPGARNNPAERIRRLGGALHMLSALREAARHIHSRGELLEEACRSASTTQQYRYAFVALANPHTRTAHTVAWTGAGAARGEEAQFHVSTGVGPDESSTAFVLRTGTPNICFDLAHYRGPLAPVERRGAEMSGSFVCLPLLAEGRAIGAITLGGIRNAMIGEQELLLLEEFAGELSFALNALPEESTVGAKSHLDPLTRLAQRESFSDHLGEVLKNAAASRESRAVVVFDIERLGDVNITYGRHVGDRLLQCVSDRLKRRFGGAADLGYFGGGTFAAVFSLQDSPGVESDKVHSETQRIPHVRPATSAQDPTTAVFGHPFAISNHAVPVTVKCGLARFPINGSDPEMLLQFAESAVQKLRDRNVKVRSPASPSHVSELPKGELEQRLRHALAHDSLALYYQPQFDQRSGKMVGAEALLRWIDPELGMVPPGTFLPAMESGDLIVPIGEWVLARAARDWRRWRELGLTPLRVAVNVSPQELSSPDFATRFLAACGSQGKTRSWIDIEITENALLEDPEAVRHMLQTLRDEGVQIAIDDFGMGFSSLNRLCELPIDTLKIDRAFVNRLTTNAQSQAVVSTIMSLARAYGLRTIAEGVETKEQLQILYTLGCEQSQGFLHSPPVTAQEFEQMIGSPSRLEKVVGPDHRAPHVGRG